MQSCGNIFFLSGKKKELLDRLEDIFERIQRDHNISGADFPDADDFRRTLDRKDFVKFNPVKDKVIEDVERVVAMEISRFFWLFVCLFVCS